MFDINRIHDHQRYEIVHKMADDQDFNVGIRFIKYGKNNPDKTGHCNLADGSVRTVENSEKSGGNNNAGIPVSVYLFNSGLYIAAHQKFFHYARGKAGKNDQFIIVSEDMGKLHKFPARAFLR